MRSVVEVGPARSGVRRAAREDRFGILAMIGAMGCFVVNDALVKYASQSLPAAQIIFVRGIFATLLVLGVAHSSDAGKRIRDAARGWVAARATVDAVATVLYLVALFHLPIANAAAINMASPLFVTVLAALLLRERVDALRWLATGVGFLGVLLIVRPRAEGFNVYALVALLATVLHAVRDLAIRRVQADVPSIVVTLSTTVAVTLLSAALTPVGGWEPMRARELAMLAVAAVFLAGGYHLMVISTRHGDLSLVAPFRYSGLLFATLAGVAVWGEWPGALAWAGIGLVVAGGVYLLRSRRGAGLPGGQPVGRS